MIDTIQALQDYLIDENRKEDGFVNQVLHDFWICCLSREVSLLGRKEVLTGKAKFGILGDGKEVPQVAMARAFQKGDWRAGYYRDQTFMMALGLCSMEDYFAQLYADPAHDPFSGGRQMNAHFATPTIDQNGDWYDLAGRYNISADISSTGGQMARGFGLAFASKKFRQFSWNDDRFSREGQEVSFVTIGDASTSEGVFWETINAAVVEQVPLAISVWDDGYGISVPKSIQTAKGSISKALSGFLKEDEDDGLLIYKAKAWDYASLISMYEKGIDLVRRHHMPAIFHIEECTQPQGHSTSGSHERYKSKNRLQWEKDHDCIDKMAEWMMMAGLADADKIAHMREQAKNEAKAAKDRAWDASLTHARMLRQELGESLAASKTIDGMAESCQQIEKELQMQSHPTIHECVSLGRKLVHGLTMVGAREQAEVIRQWIRETTDLTDEYYHRYLYSESDRAAIRVGIEPARYKEDGEWINGSQILNHFFDERLASDPRIMVFGEDVGKIGGVNQGLAGMQEKHGEERVFDTGIREWTIVGQAIGAAMRGLRPIAEIQYLDYLIYGLEPLTDDLATLRYRSNGQQMAPAIIRTRGHRLEGIWHAGSPMGMMIHSLRGIHLCVPRNMTQAAGMYATLLASDDPGIVIEVLNGYRLKEQKPENLGTFSVPLGVPEILREGQDLTLVTYGACVRVAEDAIDALNDFGISVELIDVQTLLPFDLEQIILHSLKKTNRILFLDEDVPGGATAYMMREVLETQNGYRYLDSQPATLTAHAHRPPYGSDGDYFSKPNAEDIVEKVVLIMNEANPRTFPAL